MLGDRKPRQYTEDLFQNLRQQLDTKFEDCRFTTKDVAHYLYVKVGNEEV